MPQRSCQKQKVHLVSFPSDRLPIIINFMKEPFLASAALELPFSYIIEKHFSRQKGNKGKKFIPSEVEAGKCAIKSPIITNLKTCLVKET